MGGEQIICRVSFHVGEEANGQRGREWRSEHSKLATERQGGRDSQALLTRQVQYQLTEP